MQQKQVNSSSSSSSQVLSFFMADLGCHQELIDDRPLPARSMAMPLPEELMSSVLVFLRMKDLLEWRIVSSSTKTM